VVVVFPFHLKSHSSLCCFISNLNFELLLKSVTHVYLCACGRVLRHKSWEKMNETHDMFLIASQFVCSLSWHGGDRKRSQPHLFFAFTVHITVVMMPARNNSFCQRWIIG
jgi:hypothetical protein